VKRREKSVHLFEAEGGPATGSFHEETGEREQLVIARRIKKAGYCSHGGA